jgi:putative transcriptional regulator
VRLFSIAPGTTIPHHSHGGTELTLVLSGSFSDEIGRFGPGDLADLDDSVSHQPVADTNEPCICLIATDERLRFTGMFSRLIQPLVGL